MSFSREEFTCGCGCGYDTVDYELMEVLKGLREHFNAPLHINSGARCKYHNKRVGGGDKSQHLLGSAADIRVDGVSPQDVADRLCHKFPDKYGIGSYNTFTHIDTRSRKARW